jgi:hypothetical protein
LDELQENRYRHWHVWDRGRVVEFLIQYEAFIVGQWHPVIRYDTAHGQLHRDTLHPDGTQTGDVSKLQQCRSGNHWATRHHRELPCLSGQLSEGNGMMNQFYQAKFKELFIEFTRYLLEHPEFAAHIPKDAQLVLLDCHDPRYSSQVIRFAQQAKETDEVSNRPVVYIEVREMAPIRSRLRKLEVFKSPPEYATA